MAGLRGRHTVTVATVIALGASLLVAPTPALADEPVVVPVDRTRAVALWKDGGPLVRPAAEAALLGTDDDVRSLVDRIDVLQAIDERVLTVQIYSGGGPAVRTEAQKALDNGTVETFLQTGWQQAVHTDQRIRVLQLSAAGGPQLKAAAQKALDADDASTILPLNMTDEPEGPLDEFVSVGWRSADQVDKRVRVNQILAQATVGSNVRRMAQLALDTGTPEALQEFIATGYAIGAAWDEEATNLTDLAATARTASDTARAQNERAQETAEQARLSGVEAKKAAEAALAAMKSAGDNATKAADALNRAANAAEQAGKAAQQALAASEAAVAASRAAAAAASRAMALAALTRRAANRANKAAVDAAWNGTLAENSRKMAKAASDAAKAANDSSVFLQQMLIDSTEKSIAAAEAAETDAKSALDNADAAVALAKRTGVNVAAAEAAANRARAQADKARRAAAATRKYAKIAVDAARTAIDAANRAVVDARAAAARAIEAAEHAGDATKAAKLSTEAAEAATKSAVDSVTAANKAYDIYAAGRAADAERVAIVAEQGAAATQAGLAIYEHYQRTVAWNAQEAAKRDAQTNELIAKVRSPLTERGAAVAAARRVAMNLSASGGPQTRELADAALADTDDQVITFVVTGIDVAAAADDRTAVSVLAYDTNVNLARAALQALGGTDADVARFLKDQNYPERPTDDRIAVNQVLAAAQQAGNPVSIERANAALDGTADDRRKFLVTGRFDAAATDERVQANRILAESAPGTELHGAAQNALDGPPGQLHEFLEVGRHTALRNDYDIAMQDQEMQALLAKAISAAWTATQNAQEAQSAALKAQGQAKDAIVWANKAIDSAKTAAGHATKAIASATKAEEAARSAVESANTATKASQKADAAAENANQSVAKARAAYESARGAAKEAVSDARRARDSAIAANTSANGAITIYNQVVTRVNARLEQERKENLQALQAQYIGCLHDAGPIESRIKKCQEVYQPLGIKIAKATDNRKFCNMMAPAGSEYNRTCVSDVFNPLFNSNRAMDMIQSEMAYFDAASKLGAGVLALLVIGLTCAATCTAAMAVLGGAEVTMGIGGLFGIWLEEQAVAYAAGALLSTITGARLLNEVKGVFGRIRVPAALQRVTLPAKVMDSNLARMVIGGLSCKGNSFTPGTPVVMADGSTKPIERVQAGDLVLATDPVAGDTGPKPVTDLIRGTGSKDLVDVSVDVDGDQGTATGTVTATDNHPFWVADPGEWRDAGALLPGDWLRTSSGTWVQVAALRAHTETATVHNLTVGGFHSYYVRAGDASVLVHNDEPCLTRPLALGYKVANVYAWARRKGYEHFESNPGWKTEVNDRLRHKDAPPIYVLMAGFDRGLSTQSGDWDGFLTAAFSGLKAPRPKYTKDADWDKYSDATQVEMFTMVKAFYDNSNGRGGREAWKNIKFFDRDQNLIDGDFPTVDWWNAVKLYGKPKDPKDLDGLNALWKKKLDEARYDLEKAAGTL